MAITEKIILEGEDRASRAFASAGGNLEKLDSTTKRAGATAATTTTAYDKLGKGLKAGLLAGGVATAAAGLGRLSFAAVQAAIDAGEAEAAFDTTFGVALPRASAFVEEFANKAGFTTAALEQMLAVTGNVAQGIGATETESAELAETMARLAGDVASFSNAQGGAEAVMLALQSAINGEREALKTYGLAISETEVQQAALNATGKDSVDALTRLEKAQATLTVATQKAGKAVGDLDRTQDSAANRQRAFTARLGEMQIALGQKLLPLYEALIALGEDLLPVLGDAAGGVADLVGALAPLAEFVGVLADGREDLLGWIEDLGNAEGVVGDFGRILEISTQSGLTMFSNLMTSADLLWDHFTGSDVPDKEALTRAVEQADVAMRNSGLVNYNADLGRLEDMSAGADRALLGLVNGLEGTRGGISNAAAAFDNWRNKASTLAGELQLVAEAGGNVNDVLLAASDPVFAAVEAWTTYAEALEAAKEDGISTQEQLSLLEQEVRMEAALREAGLNWQEAMTAISLATGTPIADVEKLLGDLETIDGASFSARVNIETHYTEVGTKPPTRGGTSNDSDIFNYAVGTWSTPGGPNDMVPAFLHGTEIVIPPEGSGGRADFARQLATEIARAGIVGGPRGPISFVVYANDRAGGEAAADAIESKLNDLAIQGLL